jgi:ABC-type glycerol-3-phosphate transport system permease component
MANRICVAGPKSRHCPQDRWIYWLVIIFSTLFVIFPYFWMVMTSLKPAEELMLSPPVWIPSRFVWENYVKVWNTVPLSRYIGNSVFTAGMGALIGLLFSTSAAFSLACFKTKIRKLSIALFLFTQLIPFTLPFVSFYMMMHAAKLTNTYEGLIIAYCIWSIPFCTLTMRSYFEQALPVSLLESARIDGCSKFGMFWRIGLPLVLPGLVATAIFAFITGWNDFVWASVMLVDNTKKTAAIGIYDYVGQFGSNVNKALSMTTAVLITIPTMVLFGFMQRHLVSGLTAGAVKG